MKTDTNHSFQFTFDLRMNRLILAVFLITVVPVVQGQNTFTLDSFEVTNPVVISASGPFSMAATVSLITRTSGDSSGGQYGLQPLPPETLDSVVLDFVPSLTIERLDNRIRLKWDPGEGDFMVEQTSALISPIVWIEVNGARGQWRPRECDLGSRGRGCFLSFEKVGSLIRIQ